MYKDNFIFYSQDHIYAVKIIKSDKKYQLQALFEVNVLEELNKKDPESKK